MLTNSEKSLVGEFRRDHSFGKVGLLCGHSPCHSHPLAHFDIREWNEWIRQAAPRSQQHMTFANDFNLDLNQATAFSFWEVGGVQKITEIHLPEPVAVLHPFWVDTMTMTPLQQIAGRNGESVKDHRVELLSPANSFDFASFTPTLETLPSLSPRQILQKPGRRLQGAHGEGPFLSDGCEDASLWKNWGWTAAFLGLCGFCWFLVHKHISSLHVPIVFLNNQSKQRVDNFGQSPTTAASSPIMIVWGVLKLVEQSLNKFAHVFLTAVTKVHFLLQQEPQLLGDGCRPSLHSWLGPQIEKLMINCRVGGEKKHKLSQDDPTRKGLPSVNWESAYLPHSSPFTNH